MPLAKELIECRGENLWLLPQKAIYWPAKRALLVADLHFGKVGHFRKNGIGVPPQAATKNLSRFAQLLRETRPQELYLLGDLFHSEYNQEWEDFCRLRLSFPQTRFHLLVGNHDILGPSDYQRASLITHPESLPLGPYVLSHQPLAREDLGGAYNLAGHLHPGLRLRGKGRQSLRLPCFFFGPQQAILPSFGEFTGLYEMLLQKGDRAFVIAEQAVIEISPSGT